MTQKLTILFDLDGTLVDTAPDLLSAHNYVMKKFGYNTKSIDEIKDILGKGPAFMLGRSIWGSARKELSSISNQKVKDKIQNPHHSAIHRRKENKALETTFEMKVKDLDSATLKRLATIKEAEEARTKGKEEGQ